MKKILLFIPVILIFFSCATSKKLTSKNIKLTYLDDFVVAADLQIDNTLFGGISGIDYHNGMYNLLCDQPSNPRFYEAKISLINRSIDTIIISKVIKLDKLASFFRDNRLDLEAIRYDEQNAEFVISSEGSIRNDKDPSVFTISEKGDFVSNFDIPDYFKAAQNRSRNNRVFEGLTQNIKKTGFWVAMEHPLKKDGPKPKLFPTKSPVRITNFDSKTKQATKQFAYELDGVSRIPLLYLAVNGLTEILEYAPNKFLILERAFSAGYGSHGNTIKIFEVDASSATNTLEIENLRKEDYIPAEKKLIFDFKSVKNHLTNKIIENIEGMTFGPILPNGKQSLILVADNNFNSFVKQINQFILMEFE